MSIISEDSFSAFLQGRRVRLVTLSNANGMTVKITNYGAKIVSLLVPDAKGETADVVLGFSTLQEWQTKEPYFNAVIGRYANRIKDGRFTLDGKTYQLACNNGTNHLHGGTEGFNAKIWEIVGQTPRSVSLHYRSRDGEENYPGTLDVYVTYTLSRDNALNITYEAKTDRPTIISLTNHAYFNLNGEGNGDIRDHTLQVFADYYTPLDDTACPTGVILPVEGTPLDFRQPARIGNRIDAPFFAAGRGIDNNFVVESRKSKVENGECGQPPLPLLSKEGRSRESGAEGRLAARLSAGGRTMEVWTTMPGLQVYTGNYIGHNTGKSGREYGPQCAVCLEAQNFPDAPNHDTFPSAVLRTGEVYYEKCKYKFNLSPTLS